MILKSSTFTRIFILDTLNFSFWARKDENNVSKPFEVEWPEGSFHTGYWSLCAALQRAILGPVPIPLLDANFLAQIDLPTVEKIFQSSNGIQCPMIQQRMEVLQDIGRVLLEKFGGQFFNLLKQANNSALKLVDLVTDNFYSYRDQTAYKNKTVYIYKVSSFYGDAYRVLTISQRVQILVADLWACFEGEDWGKFNDIDEITMFADYRVPQSLNYFGVIKYDEYLLARLFSDPHILPNDPLEIEIRGSSIWVVEVSTILYKQQFSTSVYTNTFSKAN